MQNFFRALWRNAFLRELVLGVAVAVALQIGLALNDLLSAIDTAKTWGELLQSTQAWAAVVALSAFTTGFKQLIVYLIQKLAGLKR